MYKKVILDSNMMHTTSNNPYVYGFDPNHPHYEIIFGSDKPIYVAQYK